MKDDKQLCGTIRKLTEQGRYKELFSGSDLDDLGVFSTPSISAARGTCRITHVDAIKQNYQTIASDTNKSVIAIVKARGYGVGLVHTCRALNEVGCKAFAVATPGAGMAVRQLLNEQPDPRGDILVLGYTPPRALELAREFALTITLTDKDVWRAYQQKLLELPPGPVVKFQINVDTAMTRVGIPAWHEDDKSMLRVVELAESIHNSPVAAFDGVYTHFPYAGDGAEEGTMPHNITHGQIHTMHTIVEQLRDKDVPIPMVHMANTAGVETYPESYNQDWITHVRPGSLIYGFSEHQHSRFRRAVSWETSLARVEKVTRDVGVGYSGSYKANAGDYIGTLTVGYADGYPQPVNGESHCVQLEDVVVPVVGDVTMDMCMVDLNAYVKKHGKMPEPDDNVRVVLMTNGPKEDVLSAERLAKRAGTVWWKLLCGIRTRNESVAREDEDTETETAPDNGKKGNGKG